jgi:uncharacterized protein (TIGR03435 family)
MVTSVVRGVLLFAVYAYTASAQVIGSPEFEAVSVHRAADNRQAEHGVSGLNPDVKQTLTLDNVSLRSLFTLAYGVSARQIFGPNWLSEERFDIVATAPASSNSDQIRLMLRTFLANSFGMLVSYDQDVMRVFSLEVAPGGPRMKDSRPGYGDHSGCVRTAGQLPAGTAVNCRNVTAADLARQIQMMASDDLGARPVIDATGLEGAFDFHLEWMADDDEGHSNVFKAVEQELGLQLVPTKKLVDIIVIKKLDRMPRE